MFRYRLYTADGDELGEATYAEWINPGEMIHFDAGKRLRVLASCRSRTRTRLRGFLKVEPAA